MSDEQSEQQAGEQSDEEQSDEEQSDEEQSGRSDDEQSDEESDDEQSEEEQSDRPTSDAERFEQLDQHIESARKTAEDADVLIDPDEPRYVESGETDEADDQAITPPA